MMCSLPDRGPTNSFRYVFAVSWQHQIPLIGLTVIAFLLEIVPLEIQRRVVNNLVKERPFQLVLALPTRPGQLLQRFEGCRRYLCWNLFGAVSGWMRILDQAARSIGLSASFWVRVSHPSTLRMVIWAAASSAQNNMAAVSAEGSTVWVLMRRLNSS